MADSGLQQLGRAIAPHTGFAAAGETEYFRRQHRYLESHTAGLRVQASPTGPLFSLNAQARDIWDLLEYPATVTEVCAQLRGRYEGAADRVQDDVGAFLEQARQRDLVARVPAPDPDAQMRARYLATLKRSLVNWFYLEHEQRMALLLRGETPQDKVAWRRLSRDIRRRRAEEFAALQAARRDGQILPDFGQLFPHTMVGLQRLDNLEHAAETVFADRVPGDFLEAGVAMGGAAVFMRGLQVAHGQPERQIWVADSFAGFPASDSSPDQPYSQHFPVGESSICYTADEVRGLFQRYDLLGRQLRLIPGWFSETLPACEVGQLAILRIDADLYASTRTVLENFYQRVSSGGFVIIDDYHSYACCRQAVDEFRAQRGITAFLQPIDRGAVYWRVP